MPAIENVYKQIVKFGKECDVSQIILFGSRARGNYLPKSDIDIAVRGCKDIDRFLEFIDDDLNTLLFVDVVDLDSGVSPELAKEIERDGVVLYEKI